MESLRLVRRTPFHEAASIPIYFVFAARICRTILFTWRIAKYPSDRWLRESETVRQTNSETTSVTKIVNSTA